MCFDQLHARVCSISRRYFINFIIMKELLHYLFFPFAVVVVVVVVVYHRSVFDRSSGQASHHRLSHTKEVMIIPKSTTSHEVQYLIWVCRNIYRLISAYLVCY